MEENIDGNTTIRNILDRNVNLLTVLGIFNGLAFYANTIEPKSIGIWLSFFFLFHSIIVLWVILIDIPNKKLSLFIFQSALLMCQLFMVGYLILSYSAIVVSLIFLGLFFLFFYLIALLLIKIMTLKIKNFNIRKKIFHFLLLLIPMLIAIIPSLYLAKYATILVKMVLEYFIKNP
jgi:hypothetical protein